MLVLSVFLLFATSFVGIPHLSFFAEQQPDSVAIAGQWRPIDSTETINIPTEAVPKNESPSMVLFRFFEIWSREQLRTSGEQVLVQFGDQLRELMLPGADLFHHQPFTKDRMKIELFQQRAKKCPLD